MKFFCEYCGNRIDAEVEHKCPHCGASYKKNKKFIKLEEERKKQSEVHNENKQKLFNHVLSTLKFSRWFLLIPLIPIIMFVVVAIIITSVFGQFGKAVNSQIENNKNNNTQLKEETGKLYDELYDSIFGEEEKESEEKEVTAKFNEYAYTSKYGVKVEKYEVVEDVFKKADEGYELVKFHLLVENLIDKEIDKEDVNCIVDGVAQNNTRTSGYSDLPFDISKGLTVKGTATFIVPKTATSYDIKYGDYITIHIEK